MHSIKAVIPTRFLAGTAGVMLMITCLIANAAPNFIFMIGDDMAVETLSCYKVGEDPATTPTLDTLCEEGARLDNFWAQPVCSPTRATLLTGRYGFRTGIGSPVGVPNTVVKNLPYPEKAENTPAELTGGAPGGGNGAMGGMGGANAMGGGMAAAGNTPPEAVGLRTDEYTFPMALKAQEALNYQTAAFGKWHLADNNNGWTEHPQRVGFDNYAGILFGEPESYFAYSKVVDGKALPNGHQVYGTSDIVNDAVSWLDKREKDAPFFLWIAFNTPHTPFHLPPIDLLNSEASKNLDPQGITNENQYLYYKAMVESLDTEVERLLSNLSEAEKQNTYIVFMGDNGTPRQVSQAPFGGTKAKGTLYQGGVNVPFIISGPGIEAGRTSQALTNSVDVYATVLELAGIDVNEGKPADKAFDSISMTPILLDDQETTGRTFAYADTFGNRGQTAKAIRNSTHKLYAKQDADEFYDLSQDPYEENDLMSSDLNEADRTQYNELKNQLTVLTETN